MSDGLPAIDPFDDGYRDAGLEAVSGVEGRTTDRWLAAIGDRIGTPPRAGGFRYLIGGWAAPRPPWLLEADPLKLFYAHRARVIQTGTLTWGLVFAASSSARDAVAIDGSGHVLYADEPTRPVPLERLRDASETIRRLPSELRQGEASTLRTEVRRDEDVVKLAAFLEVGQQRAFGWRVPPVLSPESALAISSTLLFYRHLPGRRLASPLVPLLVPPDLPRTVMIVPKRFWPRDMQAAWKQGTVG